MPNNDPSQIRGVQDLREVIASFERIRADLTKRRQDAVGDVLRSLDERIANNARTLKALNRSLELAEKELNRGRK